MLMRGVMGGEGASAPWIRAEAGPAPGLMVFPMLSAEAGMVASMANDIYRIAYERAQAALRPSAYEMARHPSWN